MVAWLLAACSFKFDRELNPGELRAKVLATQAQGTAEAWVPAQNARFRVVGSALEQRVGGNGVVVLRNLPKGSYELSITHDPDNDGTPDSILLLRGITLDLGGARDLGTVKLGATGKITGRALLDGSPVANAAITARDNTGHALQTIPVVRSDAQGQFAFPYVPSGSLQLHALFRWTLNGTEQTVVADSAAITVPPHGTVTADVQFMSPTAAPPAVLKLQTSTPTGTNPPSSITVRMTAEDGTMLIRPDLPAGSAEISDLTPGLYTVTISADGFQDSVQANVLVDGTLDLGNVLLLPVNPNANLCDTNHGGCDENAECSGDATSATCTCRSGYAGNGYTCSPAPNHCNDAPPPCGDHATCSPAGAEVQCQCEQGYQSDGARCADINECATANGGCDPDAICTNSDGSFSCACPNGFLGDGTTCTDIDECETNNGGCDPNAICTNSRGSFSCACPNGFLGDGSTCTDIDECETNNGGCPAHSTCANTPGSFSCACDTGWTASGEICVDVDECGDGHGPCDPVATCTNTEGSFTCDCPPGFGGGIVCLPCDNPEAHCCETPIQFCSRVGANCDQVTANDACGNLFTANCGACSGGQVCSLLSLNVCASTGKVTLGLSASVLNLTSTLTTGQKMALLTPATAVLNDAILPLTDGGFAGGHMKLSVGSPIAAVNNDSMWAGRPDGGSTAIPVLTRSVSTLIAAVENNSAVNLQTIHSKQAVGAPVTSVENLTPPVASYPPVTAAAPVTVDGLP